ncbi:preprotein translocase subunit SecG [Methyloceanibacter superfactus]|jgi:preprotein translocase subunit SecG|uniref:Protein-export membrane protein SecG n=1 Tax=Methyloceanibacter superfactus TaxID=1774969 RepID=A0A1E3VPB7_9HYPH|nr:preprotein translocase subunit SecG [Methyloceanibacter superfactus]ODR95370.1 preprotein translocase subunit SecG [Methyloceanibacter superfactus]
MSTVLLLIHIMVAVALVGVVLLQRSEGGALGIGGGGGGGAGGGFMTGRSAGNALTKATAVLAACFFATSMTLSILATHTGGTPSILPAGSENGLAPLQVPATPAPAIPAAPAAPQAPQSE